MKIGDIDIKKAYLGSLELTNNNAFVGEVPVIEGGGSSIQVPTNVTETHTYGQNAKLTEYEDHWYFEIYAQAYYSISSSVWVELPYECESITITLDKKITTSQGYTEYTKYINNTQSGSAVRRSSSGSFLVTRPSEITSNDVWKILLFGTTNGTVSSTQSTNYVKWSIPKSVI